jgi:hypothetical protein
VVGIVQGVEEILVERMDICTATLAMMKQKGLGNKENEESEGKVGRSITSTDKQREGDRNQRRRTHHSA